MHSEVVTKVDWYHKYIKAIWNTSLCLGAEGNKYPHPSKLNTDLELPVEESHLIVWPPAFHSQGLLHTSN
jgi:hypothetical protein